MQQPIILHLLDILQVSINTSFANLTTPFDKHKEHGSLSKGRKSSKKERILVAHVHDPGGDSTSIG